MYVKNMDESMNFYTKTMGFREAFSFKDKEGKPSLVYVFALSQRNFRQCLTLPLWGANKRKPL